MLNPVLLIIRDGWGSNHNPSQDKYNAIKIANTPICDDLSQTWPTTEISAHGPDVGLPPSIMGNSEVGHQNIGAGRIVDQEILRITKAFTSNQLDDNPVLKQLFSHKRVHLLGLVSDAGVHSTLEHLFHLIDLAKKANVQELYIHAFTDGRDTPPSSSPSFIKQIQDKCSASGLGKIASISGRYWAMDRDNRWDRIQKAYNTLTSNTPPIPPLQAIEQYYNNPTDPSMQGDEFITPTRSPDTPPIQDNDSVLFFNFRGDRPRELTHAFIDQEFDHFPRKKLNIFYATLTDYQEGLCPNVVFPRLPKMTNILGQVVSDANIRQFRCAETEKYPHVTFFFNDYRETPFPLEDRALIPSPKDVATYDQKPEMSAAAVTQATIKAIESKQYGLLVVNFANPDMVAHTGFLDATIQAVETVDTSIGLILNALDRVGGSAIITADHGNADLLWNENTHSPNTQHTLNPVEVVLYGHQYKLRPGGRLADLAPTILELMKLPQPKEMTGQSLISH